MENVGNPIKWVNFQKIIEEAVKTNPQVGLCKKRK